MHSLEDRIAGLAQGSPRANIPAMRARALQRRRRRRVATLTSACTLTVLVTATVAAIGSTGNDRPRRIGAAEQPVSSAASNPSGSALEDTATSDAANATTASGPATSVMTSATASSDSAPTTAESDTQATADPDEYRMFLESTEFHDWIGPYSIAFRDTAGDIGSIEDVTYRVEITETTFCIVATSSTLGGRGCVGDDDLSTAGVGEQSWVSGGGASSPNPARWERHFIMPSNVESLRLLIGTEPACDLTPMPMEPYVNATLWACVGNGDMPDNYELRVEATRDGVTRSAVVAPPPIGAPGSTTSIAG